MANTYTEMYVEIPVEQIEWIRILDNPVKNKARMTISQLKEKYNADYIINGTLYNMKTGEPVCPLKSMGNEMFTGPYKYWGYSWNMRFPDTFTLQIVPDTSRNNYIACSCINKDWQPVENPIYNTAQGGIRGRTAIGTTLVDGKEAICLYVSSDASGNSAKNSPEGLAKKLYQKGVRDAVMLDCGTSSQGIFKEKKISSGRRCAHYLAIKLKEEYRNG